jgi:hypothetical protein
MQASSATPDADPASPGDVSVALSGELTIRTITAAHAQLSEAFEAGSDVRVALEPGATVDLTLVQLIEAARRSAREAGGAFALAGPAEGELLAILHRGGFLTTGEQRAFWLLEVGE